MELERCPTISSSRGGRASGIWALQEVHESKPVRTKHSPPSLASPGSLPIKCIIYEDALMHIHELIAFQGQLLSLKNPPIMNYCMGSRGLGSRQDSVLKITTTSKTCFEENPPNCVYLW